jgi:hypothetical protein
LGKQPAIEEALWLVIVVIIVRIDCVAAVSVQFLGTHLNDSHGLSVLDLDDVLRLHHISRLVSK